MKYEYLEAETWHQYFLSSPGGGSGQVTLRTTVGRITHQPPGLGDGNYLVSFSHSLFGDREVLLPAHKHSRALLLNVWTEDQQCCVIQELTESRSLGDACRQ